MRSRIWRFAVAPSDAAERTRNIGAQLQSITFMKAPKTFWKIHLLYDFWCYSFLLCISNFVFKTRRFFYDIGLQKMS